ncbi:major structural protein VP1 [Betapolyomavirus ptedavyi]|uniref:Capsid protein VP1 n=1 Tax=Betapolyomavirus ptedavyi TaxID=1891773 RepID=L0G8K6_9POLY|nr:major structural protein VP1 [Betapolyomavirus ptedavyi]AGA82599.1 major structural protein VP1 [Betapolyomavirus ptedavyi]
MAPPQKRSPKLPAPAAVPKLLIKGGIEVLDLKTGPDSITQIELFLNPRMGQPTTSADWVGFSDNVTVSASWSADSPAANQTPCYSCARVSLPMINEDMTSDKILMWEAVSCKTEVVGVSSLTNVHSFKKKLHDNEGIGLPVEGLNYHMFAVGGEPLELQFLVENHHTVYGAGLKTIQNPGASAQTLNPALKGTLDKDGAYPIEAWCPDPSKNENTRYFGSYTGGQNTPPVLQFTNTVTTILLDENGVGPLCKGDGLYLSCADIVGFHTQAGNNKMKFRGLPRYFNVTLRKRVVKNPYPVSSLLNSLFTKLIPKMDGQPMSGDNGQVEEVRVYEGTEEVPGDPDMVRYIDKYGQMETEVPQ